MVDLKYIPDGLNAAELGQYSGSTAVGVEIGADINALRNMKDHTGVMSRNAAPLGDIRLSFDACGGPGD